MGGDCLNTGCVPSKALIRCARAARQLRDAERFGLQGAAGTVNFAAVMAHVHEAIRAIEPHDSVQRFRSLGVDTVEGRARVTSPWTVEILTPTGTQILSTRSIVVATGARPLVPPMPGLAEVGYLDLRNRVEPDRVAAPPGRAGRRRGGLRTGAGARAAGRRRDRRRSGAPLADKRGRGGRKAGRCCNARRRCRGARRASSAALRTRRPEAPHRRHPGRRRAHDRVRRAAGGHRPGSARHGLRARGTRCCADPEEDDRRQRLPADVGTEHLCDRRCCGPVAVHPCCGAPGLDCGGERAVRPLQAPRGRSRRDAVGHLYRSGGGSRRPHRGRSEGPGQSPTKSRATGSTSWTAPSSTAPRAASSSC